MAISQDRYFSGVLDCMKRARDKIFFEGYDAVFMNKDETKRLIVDSYKNNGVRIYAILPTDMTTYLDQLKEDSDLVKVVKTDMNLFEGKILIDHFGFFRWDSRVKTAYKPERDKGVIWRSYIIEEGTSIEDSELWKYAIGPNQARLKEKFIKQIHT